MWPPPIGFITLGEAVELVRRKALDAERTIAEGCESGLIAAAYRNNLMGADELPRDVWHSPIWPSYFVSGTIELTLPLTYADGSPVSDGRTARCPGREIFIRKDSLDEFVESIPIGSTGSKGRRGRAAAADWDAFDLALRQQISERGFPSADNDYADWRIKADVERWAAEFLADRQENVGESTIRARVSALLSQIEAGN